MLRSLEVMRGSTVRANDGNIGRVSDFIFDTMDWTVRYMAVEISDWHSRHEVLISPVAFGSPTQGVFPVELTKKDVANSPDIDSREPISRSQEEELVQYWGWPEYWGTLPGMDRPPLPENFPGAGGAIRPTVGPPLSPDQYQPGGGMLSRESADDERITARIKHDDRCCALQSTKELHGYRVHATDGMIGHLSDFIADTSANWAIRYLLVSTKNWLPAKKVLLAPTWSRETRWEKQEVIVDHSKKEIRNSPEFHPDEAVNRDYEETLFDYYGRKRYWK